MYQSNHCLVGHVMPNALAHITTCPPFYPSKVPLTILFKFHHSFSLRTYVNDLSFCLSLFITNWFTHIGLSNIILSTERNNLLQYTYDFLFQHLFLKRQHVVIVKLTSAQCNNPTSFLFRWPFFFMHPYWWKLCLIDNASGDASSADAAG